MHLLFATCFSATLLVPIGIHGADSGTAIQPILPKLPDLGALFKNMPAPPPAPLPVALASSCKELYDKYGFRANNAYMLQTDSGTIPVYCQMTSIGECGDGGWTLVMKTDGHKSTFHNNSPHWTDKKDFNLPGGKTGFDLQETKLPTYWNTPFSKICLGMKIGQQTKFIVINKPANSLYSLIADGKYRATSLGRNKWKKVIGSQASLQRNCNKEGFNAACNSYRRARIGILSNNENACTTCDSRIGFGIGPPKQITCGNVAMHGGDNGDKHIKAMGYILVR